LHGQSKDDKEDGASKADGPGYWKRKENGQKTNSVVWGLNVDFLWKVVSGVMKKGGFCLYGNLGSKN